MSEEQDISIHLGETKTPNVVEEKAPPSVETGFAVLAWGTPADPVPLYLHIQALQGLTDHGLSDTHNEVGGVLLGKLYQHSGSTYLLVEDSLPAQFADQQHASLTFTHDTWQALNKERETKRPDLSIVGWYHTHPALGVFLSDRDKFIQKNFFEELRQVAVVFDSVTGDIGAFTVREGKVVKLPGFYAYGPIERKKEIEEMAERQPKEPILITSQSLEAQGEQPRPINVNIKFAETCINFYYLMPGRLRRMLGIETPDRAPRLSVKTLLIVVLLGLTIWQHIRLESLNNLRDARQQAITESVLAAEAGDFDEAWRKHRTAIAISGRDGFNLTDRLVQSLWQLTQSLEKSSESEAMTGQMSNVRTMADIVRDQNARRAILYAWYEGCKARGYSIIADELRKLAEK